MRHHDRSGSVARVPSEYRRGGDRAARVVESCGKCTPCRIGATRGVEVIDRIVQNEDRDNNLILLTDLCDTMEFGSLCAMGGMTPFPVRSALAYFAEDFGGESPREN